MNLPGNMTPLLIVFSVLILSSSCKKEQVVLSQNQKILFQYDYSNSAWGFQHNGFFINTEGRILKYNDPQDWHEYDKEYNLTDEDISQNLSKCEDTGEIIPAGELQKYSGYIRNISLSKVSAKRNVANDAGKTEYICYLYSVPAGSYKGFLIKMEGDYTCENLNYYSRKVSEWLKNISDRISTNNFPAHN